MGQQPLCLLPLFFYKTHPASIGTIVLSQEKNYTAYERTDRVKRTKGTDERRSN